MSLNLARHWDDGGAMVVNGISPTLMKKQSLGCRGSGCLTVSATGVFFTSFSTLSLPSA